jgi:hypothetical protein
MPLSLGGLELALGFTESEYPEKPDFNLNPKGCTELIPRIHFDEGADSDKRWAVSTTHWYNIHPTFWSAFKDWWEMISVERFRYWRQF